MSETLKTRAGASFRAQLRLWQPDRTELVNTAGYTIRFEMKAAESPGRIILSTEEYTGALPSPAGTILTRIEPGHWELFLGKSFTKRLPPTCIFEIEMVNNTNSEDAIPLATGILNVDPARILEVIE